MKNFDLIIVGGGAGAFAAAIRANELNAKAALINTGLPLGGTCVNVGCVPSKALLWAAETLYRAEHHGIPGIDSTAQNFSFQKVISDELSLVERLQHEKYEKVLSGLEYVTFINGKAVFISPREVEVNGERLFSEKFIIATGSTSVIPPIEGIRKIGFITHMEALRLKQRPGSLIVIGAGPLGLEFSQMYSRFGTAVTVLQDGGRIFPPGEPELTEKLEKIFSGEGITVHLNSCVLNVRAENKKKILTFGKDGGKQEISADEILLAAGKSPNTDDLGLGAAGVAVDGRKTISVSESLQTSQSHIFAVGDVVNLPLRLETTAGREGTLAVENALNGSQNKINYDTVPYAIFTDPQYAGVGPTEDFRAKRSGMYACRTLSFADVPKGIITRRIGGLIKMSINSKTKRIVSVHILAPNAGDFIAEAMMLIKNRNTIDDAVNSLPVFPTMSEAIKIVALSFSKDISGLSCCV